MKRQVHSTEDGQEASSSKLGRLHHYDLRDEKCGKERRKLHLKSQLTDPDSAYTALNPAQMNSTRQLHLGQLPHNRENPSQIPRVRTTSISLFDM